MSSHFLGIKLSVYFSGKCVPKGHTHSQLLKLGSSDLVLFSPQCVRRQPATQAKEKFIRNMGLI